jgi:hypothetical protein
MASPDRGVSRCAKAPAIPAAHIEALLPRREFRLSDGKGMAVTVRAPSSGKVEDLGDVHMEIQKTRE